MSCIAFDGSKTISFGIGESQSISPLIPPSRRVTTSTTGSGNIKTRKQLYRHVSRDFEIKSGSRSGMTANKDKEKSENDGERYGSPGYHTNNDTNRVAMKNNPHQQYHPGETTHSNVLYDVENVNNVQRKSISDSIRERNIVNNKPQTLLNNINSENDKMDEILRLQNKMAKLQNKVATMQKQVLHLQKQI